MRYQKQNTPQTTPMPRPGEVVGTVRRALGASKFEVAGSDGNIRVCSIPGRLKRRFWVKEGDVVLVKPWVVQSNERGDIVWRYSIMDKEKLKARGILIP
ncbi:MAG: translation initiation factor IF-1A [Candidatus Micrarchaeota archaeon]|nr:translation initiation factor IF-1A [Candidatus Micrarchaeota archaeon]